MMISEVRVNRNQMLAWLALIMAIGLIMFIFESLIPRPLPWLKPGLANTATLIALYLFGFRAAMIVVIGRVVLGSIIMGTLFNPAFVLAIGGGVMATLMMAFFKKIGSSIFSIFGISVIGAVTHNIMQLILVFFILIKQFHIFYLLPLLIISALFTGIIVAFISYHLILYLKKHYQI